MKIVTVPQATPQTMPQTMPARRARIASILATKPVASQHELGELLLAEGISVTQTTLSRDLEAIGAVKQNDVSGQVRYVTNIAGVEFGPNSDSVSKIVAEVLIGAEAAQNIAVLRTPPGAAHYLAGTLDRSGSTDIVGTVAGDDTVLVVMRTAEAALELCVRLLRLAERSGTTIPTSAVGGARKRRTS
ncbi:MAG: arginine repressor [Actinobacteria bacterium]|nr:MAG: arginine repressor [Actinomycetota bacterium]